MTFDVLLEYLCQPRPRNPKATPTPRPEPKAYAKAKAVPSVISGLGNETESEIKEPLGPGGVVDRVLELKSNPGPLPPTKSHTTPGFLRGRHPRHAVPDNAVFAFLCLDSW